MSRLIGFFRGLVPNGSEFVEDMRAWMGAYGPWWATSVVAHAVVLAVAMLTLGTVATATIDSEAPAFDATNDAEIKKPEELTNFEVGETPYEPSELTAESLTQTEDTRVGGEEEINGSPDDAFQQEGGGVADAATNLGGLNGFDVRAIGPGPQIKGEGGLAGRGTGNNAGSGGAGTGFGSRGAGRRRGGTGATAGTERAVAAALFWLAKHQNSDGSWSLNGYHDHCKDATCTGQGNLGADVGATALALLPFLAAGQTHHSKGPYQENIQKGLAWLITQQNKGDGNLGVSSPQFIMYTHGLATIVLCEAYGLSGDPQIGTAAQAAIDFIVSAQSSKDGGWRYKPKDQDGDTSVVGWQVMALKSGKMAGLKVPEATFEEVKKYLKAASVKGYGGLFGYQPGTPETKTMTAVGLLCSQYLGTGPSDPGMQEGVSYLDKLGPNGKEKNVYYWYYATQVMHNLPGERWNNWNKQMRRILIDSQATEGCATGSWDPATDPFAEGGGRLYTTSLCCLTLEIYYRYLPLYQLDAPGVKPAAATTTDSGAKKPAESIANRD